MEVTFLRYCCGKLGELHYVLEHLVELWAGTGGRGIDDAYSLSDLYEISLSSTPDLARRFVAICAEAVFSMLVGSL